MRLRVASSAGLLANPRGIRDRQPSHLRAVAQPCADARVIATCLGPTMMTGAPTSSALRLGGAALVMLLAACGPEVRYVAPPPAKVTVVTPDKQTVTRYLEANGSAAAVNSANLVARVSGFLQSIEYKDGDQVKQGAVLFVIEPEPYKLKLEQAQAAEASAEASLRQLEAEYQRQVDLASRGIASKATLDTATANRDVGQAKLKQAQADTKQAEINLGYTQVKAPFDGIVTARLVSRGELVGANGPTQLATIVQTDPIYVNFNISEQDVLRIRDEIRRLGLTPEEIKRVPVEVGLQNEQGYPHKGTVDYAPPTISQATGTLTVRAILHNPSQVLVPGYFVRVRVPEQPEEALLVPDVALGADQGGRYVLVVNKDDVVEQRKVTVGPRFGEMRAIESGLKADDRVIVAGIQRAVPGQKVDPQKQTAAAAPADRAK
jgi:RND family efflux transporter MFP subunit